MSKRVRPTLAVAAALCIFGFGAQIAFAAVVPTDSIVRSKEFSHPGLSVQTHLVRGTDTERRVDLERLLVPAELAYLDPATGRWATLIPTQPLIPGTGVGNHLDWSDLKRAAPLDRDELANAAGDALRRYFSDFAEELRVSVDEFSDLNVAVHDHTIVLSASRAVGQVPVRNSFVTATMSQGNLILLGAARWGDVNISARPALEVREAIEVLRSYLGDLPGAGRWGDSELAFVPYSDSATLEYRLVFSLKPKFEDDLGRWEGLVDAHTGELLSFLDTNHYATRHVVGGVYPASNDGNGPDGVEQPGWAMPFASLNGGEAYSDANGNFPPGLDGEVSTDLDGLYLRIIDTCGDVLETSDDPNDIDLGVSDGDDCTTPPGASPGNTHSSRTTFHETNRVKEWARSRWPDNHWLSLRLTANVNITASCNAFYNGWINMYRSGGGCGNTGEIAGIIDHEWGHGMDQNDNREGFSFPSEGIADVYAALRLDDSCIGRAFFDNGNCNGYGDPCLDCSGIRDIDFAMRQSGEPHDPQWADSNCGGCGGSNQHCQGAIYAEAVWDLRARDLADQFGVNDDLALEMTTWYTIKGATNVGSWYTCGFDGEDGCAAEGGYLNYAAADDNDGSLANGTPHMSAIFNAFDRHGIACSAPAVQNAGCDGPPGEAPVVTATAGDSSVSLDWDPVAGATRYHVFRTDGVKGCNKGKIYLGKTGATSFEDDGLLNGTEFYYMVLAADGGRSCVSQASACAAATPNS